MNRQHRRTPQPKTAGILQPWLPLWTISLKAADRDDKTVELYHVAARLFGTWLERHHPDIDDVDQLRRQHFEAFFGWVLAGGDPCPHDLTGGTPPECPGYGRGTAVQYAGSLKQFTRFWSDEEQRPDPMARARVPKQYKLGENVPPVIEAEALAKLIRSAEKGRDFPDRRDAAILRLFAASGCRLSELAQLRVEDVSTQKMELAVVGKGNRARVARFDQRANFAVARYLKDRARHPAASTTDLLWLGRRREGGMTISGVYQVIERRGRDVGLRLHPHMFRHTFAHRWLDNEGAEGDLMALAGWSSPQMLRHYGASARAARAHRAYDKVMKRLPAL